LRIEQTKDGFTMDHHAITPDDPSAQSPDHDLWRLFHSPEFEAQPLQIPAGAKLRHSPGSDDRQIYMITAGQIWTYQLGICDHTRLVEILGPREWFWAASLVESPEAHWEAVAVADSSVLQLPVQRLLSLLPTHPKAAADLIQHLASKLHSARDDAKQLVFDDCNQRLIKTLLRFSRTAAAHWHERNVVLRITHQQLADAVGAARETISLALTELRQKDLLRTGRNQLIFDPQALRRALGQPTASSPPTPDPCA
jgi:CRP/FNR family transcriptional regulator